MCASLLRIRLCSCAIASIGICATGLAQPSIEGQWSPNMIPLKPATAQVGTVGIHAVLQPNGWVLAFGVASNAEPYADECDVVLLNPVTGEIKCVADHMGFITDDPNDPNLKTLFGMDWFCSGHCMLASGQTVLFGGGGIPHNVYGRTMVYSPDLSGSGGIGKIRPGAREQWGSAVQDGVPRWYPTATTLSLSPQGYDRVLVTEGNTFDYYPVMPPENKCCTAAPYPETETPVIWNIPDPNNKDTWFVEPLEGARYRLLSPSPYTWELPTYPLMFYHDGTPYYAGGVETPCDSNLTSYRQSRILDTVCETWTDFPTTMDSNDIPGAAAVMFAPGRILKAGGPLTFNPNGCVQGNLPITTATNRVRRINLAVDSGGWAAAAPMAIEREWLSLVCLPSGRILAVGGPANSHPEMYDPNADTWTQMALMVDKRGHHAVGLLCPDGSVYVAGGEYKVEEPEGRTYRIYKPPYFFQGTRPSITSIPDVIQYGTPFTVGVTTTNPITKVRLVRPGAITHSFDQNARIMELSFAVQSSTSIRVAAPVNQQFAPPGYYMVFVCEDSVSGDGGGLPSEGKFVKLELPDS